MRPCVIRPTILHEECSTGPCGRPGVRTGNGLPTRGGPTKFRRKSSQTKRQAIDEPTAYLSAIHV